MTAPAWFLKYRIAAKNLLRQNPSLVFRTVLVAIVLFGMVQASVRLGHSLSIDEPFTANMVQLPWPEMIEAFWQDNAAPLHYILLKVWAQAFGESEIALRIPSLLFFGLTILAIGLTARGVAGLYSGLIAALLFSTSTTMSLVYAATARPYALLCLQVSIATYIFFCLLRLVFPLPVTHDSEPTKKAWLYLLLTVLNVLGLLTHPIYAFYMCSFSLAALFVSRRAFLLLIVCSAISLGIYLAFVGSIAFNVLQLPTTNWMERPNFANLMTAFLNLWGRKKSLLLLAYLVWIAVFRFSDGIQVFTSELSLVSVCIISVASLLPFVISQYKPVFVEYRTPIIFLPIACILTAVLISRLGFRVWTAIILILFVAGSTIRSGQNLVDPDPYPTRTSVQYVVERAKCGDTLVLGSLSISEVEYYLRRLGAPDCIERETFPLDTQDHPGWMDVPGLLRRRGELALEATETAARLAERSGATVWLFYGDDSCYGHEVTDILKPRLDNQLDFVKTLDLEGSFFDSVRVYSAKN